LKRCLMIPGAVEANVLLDGRVGEILLPDTPGVQHPRPREDLLRDGVEYIMMKQTDRDMSASLANLQIREVTLKSSA